MGKSCGGSKRAAPPHTSTHLQAQQPEEHGAGGVPRQAAVPLRPALLRPRPHGHWAGVLVSVARPRLVLSRCRVVVFPRLLARPAAAVARGLGRRLFPPARAPLRRPPSFACAPLRSSPSRFAAPSTACARASSSSTRFASAASNLSLPWSHELLYYAASEPTLLPPGPQAADTDL